MQKYDEKNKAKCNGCHWLCEKNNTCGFCTDYDDAWVARLNPGPCENYITTEQVRLLQNTVKQLREECDELRMQVESTSLDNAYYRALLK